jgi:uncharacterized membrane-anchored protein
VHTDDELGLRPLVRGVAGIARDPERLAAYVEARRRSRLDGLSKGLITAGQSAVEEPAVLYPF